MVFARRQAETLAQRGIAVDTFYLRSRTSPVSLAREARRFLAERRRLRPDIVHAHFGTVTGLFAVLFSGRAPVVITYRGSDLNRVPTAEGVRAKLGRVFSRLAALGARRIVCVSRQLRDRLWWSKHRTVILPSGVDSERFHPMPRDAARAGLGWPASEQVVLFNAGHDARNKRLDLADAAVAELRKTLPRARLHVLTGNVPPEKIPLLMNAADCLLVTSDAEGSPTVVQEAMATNLPIVSVAVGDVPERLAGIEPAAIAARSPEALARSLAAILRQERRSNGRSRIREVSAHHIADELTQLYLDAIAPDRRTALWNTTLSSPQSR